MTNDEREKAIIWFEGRTKATTMPGERYMFELAMEALREQDGWRDAIKDQPEPHETVLVYLPGDNPFCKVREGRLSRDGTWHARLFDCEPGEVTHWRPMPKPPEKEGEKQ